MAPEHLDAHGVSQRPGREDSHVIIPAEISTAAHHLLALERHSPAAHEYLCADAARVPAQSFEADGDARSDAVVAVNARWLIQAIHDDVQIAVIIQVCQRHPVAYAFIVEAPPSTVIFEAQVSQIAKCHARQTELRIHEDFIFLVLTHASQGSYARGGVEILRIEWIAGGHD